KQRMQPNLPESIHGGADRGRSRDHPHCRGSPLSPRLTPQGPSRVGPETDKIPKQGNAQEEADPLRAGAPTNQVVEHRRASERRKTKDVGNLSCWGDIVVHDYATTHSEVPLPFRQSYRGQAEGKNHV